jgi:hypothetical protein
MQRAYDPRYGEARVPPPRQQAAEPHAVPRDPSPPVPPVSSPPSAAPDPIPEAAIPDWLGERLREDAAREERSEWSSLWKRRLATWSMAGGLLAIVAAGGLWVYEDSRVDGALGVVAQTSPEQPASSSARVLTPAPVAEAPPPAAALLPAPSPVSSPAPDPAPASSAASPSAPESAPGAPVPAAIAQAKPALPAASSDAGASTFSPAAQAVESRAAARAERKSQSARRNAVRHQVAQADKPRRPAAAPVPAEPSPRQRREETLMQCRAHGYDQRQCDRRGCTMTTYGFACRG